MALMKTTNNCVFSLFSRLSSRPHKLSSPFHLPLFSCFSGQLIKGRAINSCCWSFGQDSCTTEMSLLLLSIPFLLLSLIVNFCCANASAFEQKRILFTGAVDSGTHIASMVPLIKRLASQGHHVTVLELATLEKPRQLGPNVSVLFIPVPVDQGLATAQAAAMFREVLNGRTLHLPYEFGNDRFVEFLETHPQMFVSLLNAQFDLVVLDELFGVHSFAIALHLHRFQRVPYVIYSTTMMVQSSAYALALGTPSNFVAEPNLLTSPPSDSRDWYTAGNWLDRLDNLRTICWDLARVQFQTEHFLNSPKSALPLLGVDNFSFREFFSQASFVFVDYLDRMPAPLAEGPDLLSISAHCPASRPLPPKLAEFVEQPDSAGTIFVAFGTNVQWRFAPPALVRALFRSLNRLRAYRIVFSFNGQVPANLSLGPHLRVVPWAPQYDLLAHPRTKLFISHAGLKSFKETLCAKVPAVYMPVYAEQSYNTKVALRLGFARAVNKFTASETALDSAIQEVFSEKVLSNHGRFKRNVERANAFFLDRPLEGMEMAEFGVRKAIEQRKKQKSSRDSTGGHWQKWRIRKGMEMDWLRHANGDLLLAVLGVILLLAYRQ